MLKTISVAAIVLIAGASAGLAKSKVSNPQNKPPGKMMQTKGSYKNSPGASGYTPGHEMQQNGSRNAPGASSYAPGQGTSR